MTDTIQYNVKFKKIHDNLNIVYPYTRTAGGEEHVFPIKSDYQMSKKLILDLLLWLEMEDMPLWVYGPHGSGKTSCLMQFAAALKQPSVFNNGDPEAEKSDFNAVMGIGKDGGTNTIYSSLVQSMKKGWWYVINEADLIRSGVLASLNTFTNRVIIQHSGEVVTPQKGFRLIVTANTVGRGDYTGKHQVEMQNRALMDRFFKIHVDYPNKKVEIDILKKIYPLPEGFTDKGTWDVVIESYVQFANIIRAAHKGEEIELNGRVEALSLSETLSTRSLILWVGMNIKTGGRKPFKETLNYLLALDAPEVEVDREIIDTLGKTVFGAMWSEGIKLGVA